MATTKRTSKKSRRSTGSSPDSSSRRSFTARTGKAIKDRPVATAAIATGLVSGLAAGVAGFLAFKKSGKSFAEFSDDLTTNAKTRIKDGIAEVKSRAGTWPEPRKDGVDDGRTQSEIAEEAMTRKQIGKKTKRPVDQTVDKELKTGALSY